jgi:calcium-dependent protein kinase
MTDILNAIIYCHNHNIVHRDIKAENILFSEKDISSECKLIDFGISLKFSRDAKLQDKTGTILYVAPEVLKGSYDEKCDIWACGVLLYLILCGYPPFYGSTR